MKQSILLKYVIVVSLLIIVAGGSSFLTWRMTLNKLTIESVSPTQIANAMKADNFYSNYNENTLLVKGVISSTSHQGGDWVIGLSTSSSFKSLCDLGTTSTKLQKGDNVSVLAEAATAERQTNAIMLKSCIIL
jgi:hypothetical protein